MFWLILLVLILTIVYFIWDNMVFENEYYDIKIPHLDSNLDGVKICHLSDLRLGHQGVNLKKLVASIKEEKPNIIVITGNLFASDIDRENQNSIRYLGQSLKDFGPIYAVPGSDDLPYLQGDKWAKTLESHGIRPLLDQVAYVTIKGRTINIIGLKETQEMNDYELVPESRTFMENITVKASEKNNPSILLAHHPEFFEQYLQSDIKIDLVLSGHTMGGGVILPMIGGVYAPGQGFNPTYDFGMFSSKKAPAIRMVVNKGLSNRRFSFRIFNRMEVSYITLH